MSTDNKALFGDDDSSSSDEELLDDDKEDEKKVKKDVEMKDAETKKKKKVHSDSDDSDSDGEKDKKKEATKKKKKKEDSDSDNSESDGAKDKKKEATKKKKKEDSDSDNSDSDEDKEKKKEATKKKKKKEDSDSDDSDSDGDEDKKKEKKKKEKDDELEDSDDEGDAEFDDAGAKIVGLSSTTLAGGKAAEKNDAADGAGDVKMKKEEETPPLKLDRPIIVQEVKTRPVEDRHQLCMTKLPNILGIQQDCFDPNTYSAKTEEEDFGQASYNLIRWRYKQKHGENVRNDSTDELVRESNTRLVEWEDGSFTLHVGTETFQVDLTNTGDPKTGFAGINGYIYLSQTATYGSSKKEGEGDEAEEKKEEPAGTVLECMGSVTSRLAVRPSSLQSEAHKSLTVGIRQKTIKKARIAQYVTQEDPEKLKQERIKNKEEVERAENRKKGSYRSYGGGGGGGRRRPRMSRSYLEDDRDYDTTNLRDMKRRTMDDDFIDDEIDDYDGYQRYDDDEEEDDDEEDETFHRVRPGRNKKKMEGKKKQKQALEDDESEEDEIFGQDDDDDEEEEIMVKNRKKRSHQAVLDDDDDDSD